MGGERAPANGFSLLEVVVALAVFSLGAVALLNVLGESGRAYTAHQDRFIALIVAENRLVEAMALSRPPPPGETSGVEQMLGREWSWRLTTAPTADPRILRLDASVSLKGDLAPQASVATFRAVAP